MEVVDTAQINTFGTTSPKADFVPPSDEIFVLTGPQLRGIITRAIQEATEPILREIQDLRARQERDYERFAGDICDHGQRLRKLGKIEPQPLQRDRGDLLRALLAANGGKMLAKDARQKMHLSRSRFSELLASMQDDIDLKPYHLKKNLKVLILR